MRGAKFRKLILNLLCREWAGRKDMDYTYFATIYIHAFRVIGTIDGNYLDVVEWEFIGQSRLSSPRGHDRELISF